MIGVRGSQNRTGLAGGEGTQTDAVGQVRVQAAQAPLLQSLRGQEQMHLQRSSQSTNGHEGVDEVRLGGQKLGELVQDDEQCRKRVAVVLALDPILLVVHDVGVVSSVVEHLLTTVHLTAQRLSHTVDEPELALQVGDHRRDVRELGHSGEGRSTLEVDQDEVELVRSVSEGQGQHERAQHLRLT